MYYKRYTNAIDELYNNLNILIQNQIFENKFIVMFGTNKVASMVCYYLKEKGIKINAIVDNDKYRQGTDVFGLHVYQPEKLLKDFKENAVILLASSYQDEMTKQLVSMGYIPNKHIIKAIDLPKAMNDYSFVNRKEYTEMNDKDVKKSQLNILKFLNKISKENGLRYYICGGTLLGAVRHQGYIPWDDDIDVLMCIDDIPKFIDIVKNEPNFSTISFANPEDDYYDDTTLLFDNNTICDSNHFPMQLSSGISIEIFPLIGLPDEENAIKEYAKELKNAEMMVFNKIYDKKRCKKASLELFELMHKYSFEQSKFVGHILGPYFMKEIRPKEWFENTVELKFEDETFSAPIGYDGYLKKLFGDYMKLPPKEKRFSHHYYHAYYKN